MLDVIWSYAIEKNTSILCINIVLGFNNSNAIVFDIYCYDNGEI